MHFAAGGWPLNNASDQRPNNLRTTLPSNVDILPWTS